MNTNDLPPAAKLAALIEAGRAANPDLKQGRGSWYDAGKRAACAMGFASLGCGVNRKDIVSLGAEPLICAIGISAEDWFRFCSPITRMNDTGASLDEIILSLREGELAQVSA